jgi:transcriptional regulator with XRE-family HTH domain
MNENCYYESLLATLGKKLRMLRHLKGDEKNYTAAKAVGISSAMLSRIENGNYPPLNLQTIVALANYYQVKLLTFFKRMKAGL